MNIKQKIDKIILNKNNSKAESCGYDKAFLIKTLLKDYNKTLEFLKTANKEEFALCIEGLINFTKKYNSQEVFNLFEEVGKKYPDINDFCNEDYFSILKESKKLLKNNKIKMFNSSIKQEVYKAISDRKAIKAVSYANFVCTSGDDTEFIINAMLKNYDDTLNFLKNGNEEVFATCVEGLVEFCTKYKSWKVYELFENAGKKYPNINDICIFDYFETCNEAKRVLNDLNPIEK